VKVLPNFPADVLDQWIVKTSGVLSQFSWFEPTRASFSEEEWSTNRILREIEHWHEGGVEMEVAKFLEERSYRETFGLSKFMRENGTWPVAPIVFDNENGQQIQFGGGSPRYVMLEGMHRLGFLRGMKQLEPERLLQKHRVWLVRVDAAA
jgi:hypothetical protein